MEFVWIGYEARIGEYWYGILQIDIRQLRRGYRCPFLWLVVGWSSSIPFFVLLLNKVGWWIIRLEGYFDSKFGIYVISHGDAYSNEDMQFWLGS